MKRSYPYTGPGSAPSQASLPQAAHSSSTDFSAYGYGGNSALASNPGLSQEAQQAQWHQQWQQYYAQQAANSNNSGQAQNRPVLPAQPQTPQAFANQQTYYPQQQMPSQSPQQVHNPSFSWPNQQQSYHQQPQHQPSHQHQTIAQAYPAQQQQQQQATLYNPNQASIGPAAKRPRFDPSTQQQQQQPMRQMGGLNSQLQAGGFANQALTGIGPQRFPTPAHNVPGTQSHSGGHSGWQGGTQSGGVGTGPMRMGPMRGGPAMSPPHVGGPSNMAGPMAASPSRPPNAPRGPGSLPMQRPARPQPMMNRPSVPTAPASALGAGGRFNGPVGVNALTPQGRPGFGAGRMGSPGNIATARKVGLGPRNGVPNGPSGRGNRLEHGRGKNASSVNKTVPHNKTSSAFEMSKAPAVNGRLSSLADQPVPASSKRTFSDFKIRALCIDPIEWQWQQADDGEEEDEEEMGGEDDDTMLSTNDVDSVDGSVQGRGRRSRHSKKRERSDLTKDASRLRICFAANLPPPGAPTGPKALTRKEETEQPTPPAVISTNTDAEPEWTAFSRGPPQSSTNRINISYASSKRRLVIDADVVKSVEINRAEGTLKIVVNVKTAPGVKRRDQLEKKKGKEWVVLKGVLLEGREVETDNFAAISRPELERSWREEGGLVGEEDAAVQMAELTEGEDEAAATTSGGATSAPTGDSLESQRNSQLGEEEANHSGEDEDAKAGDGQQSDVGGDMLWRDYFSLPPFHHLLSQQQENNEQDENAIAEDGGEEAEEKRDAHPASGSNELTITVFLAAMSAKQEPRWVKTGDVEEWLSALPGFQSSLSSTAGTGLVQAWTDKIHILDPDPPPTLADVLEEWVKKSFTGTLAERRIFLRDHQPQSVTGMTELICKLVRGERANPSPTMRELGAPLQAVMENSTFHQSHLTLSIWAIVGLAKEFAGLAGIDEEAMGARLRDIILCLPTHLIFRAFDGLLKEALHNKSGRNRTGQPAASAALTSAAAAGPAGSKTSLAADVPSDVAKGHDTAEATSSNAEDTTAMVSLRETLGDTIGEDALVQEDVTAEAETEPEPEEEDQIEAGDSCSLTVPGAASGELDEGGGEVGDGSIKAEATASALQHFADFEEAQASSAGKWLAQEGRSSLSTANGDPVTGAVDAFLEEAAAEAAKGLSVTASAVPISTLKDEGKDEK